MEHEGKVFIAVKGEGIAASFELDQIEKEPVL